MIIISPNSANLLNPIMFAEMLLFSFYINENTETLFETADNRHQPINYWLIQDKLPLNVVITKFIHFHKHLLRDSIPSRLPILKFNSIEIKGETSMRFLGVIAHENTE